MPLSLISLSPVFCVGGKAERKILGIGSRYFYCGSIYSKILLFGHDVCPPGPVQGMRFSVPLGTFFDPWGSPGDTLDTCSVISSTSSTRLSIQFFFEKFPKIHFLFRSPKYYMKNDVLCVVCGKKPKRSAICLVCGALVCYEGGDRGKEPNPCSLANRNTDENQRRKMGPIVR